MKALFKRMTITLFSFLMLAGHSQGYGGFCKKCNFYDDRFWFDADYLYWQIKNSPEPVPLVAEQPATDPSFKVVLGDKKVDLGWRSGAKFALGYWFDRNSSLGLEINYFGLPKDSKKFRVASDENGFPRLRVPFFNVQTNLEDSSALATPGLYQGMAFLKVDNRMQGAELNLMGVFPSCSNQRFGIFAGFRWWNFDEHLKFFANSPLISPPSVYNYQDKFYAENNFYGGQVGGTFDYSYGAFFFNFRGKLALGAMCQQTDIHGFFATNEFTGQNEIFKGGFFALPTNIGHHKRTRFSALPELDINIGYEFAECFNIKVGYSLLYVSNVLWAGKQIDRKINPYSSEDFFLIKF